MYRTRGHKREIDEGDSFLILQTQAAQSYQENHTELKITADT